MEVSRGSGRTGRRRYSEEEARLAGPRALHDWQRRYGKAGSGLAPRPASERAAAAPATAVAALPPVPEWFDDDLERIWTEVVAAAPARLLAAADHPALVGYVVAIAQHHRLARLVALDPSGPLSPLGPELRRAAAELRAAAKHLGLSAYERQRIAVPPPPSAEPTNPHAQFRVIQFAPGRAKRG